MADKKCACGCGETLPIWVEEAGGKYINDRHRLAKERRDAWLALQQRLNSNPYQTQAYCSAFDKENITCIKCYDDQVCRFRGCYEDPRKTQVRNEVREVREDNVNNGEHAEEKAS